MNSLTLRSLYIYTFPLIFFKEAFLKQLDQVRLRLHRQLLTQVLLYQQPLKLLDLLLQLQLLRLLLAKGLVLVLLSS